MSDADPDPLFWRLNRNEKLAESEKFSADSMLFC